MTSRIALCAALAAVSLASPALAQDEGEPIVVRGEGLPDTPGAAAYSTIVLTREEVIGSASGRLEDVLSNIAGFQQFRRSDSRSANPTAQGATLRALGGNATSRALVTLDGVPVSDPFFGYVPFSALAPERLGRIVVTRGGGSGPFGSGALAGTIALESAGPRDLGLVTGSALANDRGETELGASIAPVLGEGYATISGRWDRGEGFYTTPANQRDPATVRAAFDGWSASARVVQPVGNAAEIQLRGLAYRDERTLRFDGADSSSEGEDVSLRLITDGLWQIEALAYAQWRNFTNRVISSTRFTLVLDQKDTPSTGLGGKLEIRPPVGGGHALRIGADYRRSEGELFEDAFSAFTGALREERFAGGTNTDLGLFVEDDWQYGPLTLTAGLRADRYTIADGFYRARDAGGAVLVDDAFADRSDWEVSWRGGVLLRPGPGFAVRGAAYRGLRLPTLNELYRPFVVFPVVTEANAALEPERMEGWEAGFNWEPAEGVSLAATWFDNDVKGAIANVTLEPNLRQRRNLDAIAAQGLELAARVSQGGFDLAGTLTIVDAKLRGEGPASALDGNRPPQTPAIVGSLSGSYGWTSGARLGLTLRHVGEQFESDSETDALPAATTVDAVASVPLLADLDAVLRVENLLDEVIVTRNAGGTLDLGAPRTVWFGIRYGL